MQVTSIKIGFVLWKLETKYIGQKDFISTTQHISIAPHSDCTGFDFFIYPGITYTMAEGEIAVPW